MDWNKAVKIVEPHVVKVSTPDGCGTGYLFTRSEKAGLVAVATAAHVVDDAHYWEKPIKIEHYQSQKSVLLRQPDRVVYLNEDMDTAAVIFDIDELPFPKETLELVPENASMHVGFEVGWVGFPGIARQNLCLFSGRVSCFQKGHSRYLIDGVAINGVSGGPTFFFWKEEVRFMGVVSAYIANRATGEALPGLLVVSNVTQFHELIKSVKSFEEAKEKETQPESPPPPSPKASAG
jgi:hypothetical protein